MLYVSTRGYDKKFTSAEAIKQGLAPDGGLFMPEYIPSLSEEELKALAPLPYADRAARILSLYLTDYDKEELLKDCREAYCEGSFPGGAAPAVKLCDGKYILELFHGPTCAFKDMALQIMPRLLSSALKMTGEEKTAYILVATSGDTGKAALEGYRDVDGVCIKVFYPTGGVSEIQKLQMATQEGNNVSVQAIVGNFDDAQTGVKRIFSDPEAVRELYERGYILTSANSINWGRLAPQIVYYISAYLDLWQAGEIEFGERLDVCVPTGNFGNIFACYMAKRMGLPVGKLICASNKNNVLTDFLQSGVYDRNREFYKTASPSMDILISSNVERLLYTLCGAEKTKEYMKMLNASGRYALDEAELSLVREAFEGSYAAEEDTASTIRGVYEGYGYLSDTHTAVALFSALKKEGKVLTVSTASPYKFAQDVLASIGGKAGDGLFDPLDALYEMTSVPVPEPLAALKGKRVRFEGAILPEEMRNSL